MATDTFSALPAEIHVNIAEHCANTSLINLCITSKLVNQRCLHVIYHHVRLQLDRGHSGTLTDEKSADALFRRQQQFVHTLLSHSEYGKHVKVLDIKLCIPGLENHHRLEENMGSKEELWRALQSLRNIRSVHIALEKNFLRQLAATKEQFPHVLFESATSVRLVGKMQYSLAKSILDAINPATLKHLCLDLVRDHNPEGLDVIVPGPRSEDGRIIVPGVMSGLLTTLTGRCTALRTLILRRVGLCGRSRYWDTAADEAVYVEWASFIRSVQGTVEKFKFDLAATWHSKAVLPSPIIWSWMDERFRRLVLPAIVSGNWPCLTIIELRGVTRDGQDGQASLTIELEAILGGNTKVVVEENASHKHEFPEPFCWD